MSKPLATFIAFIFFIVGGLSLVLSLIGVQLSYLTWIDKPSPMFGFLIRIGMILGGVVIVVLTRSDWREDEEMQDV